MNKPQLNIKSFTLSILIGLLTTVFPLTLYAQKWKDDAWVRINKHRKSDLSITVLSETGEPIENALVKVKLKRHKFNFGAVIRSEFYNSSPYKNIYRELFIKYFNSGGMSLGIKPKHRGKRNEKSVEQAIPWFNTNHIAMRGHALVWEGKKFLPADALAIYNQTNLTDQEKGERLVQSLNQHFYHAIPKWDVEWWDVVNEPVVNDIANQLLPNSNTFAHWFKLADSLRKLHNKSDVKLVLNENQIISGNAKWAKNKIGKFQTIIDQMLAESAPVEMLGFQSRIKYGMLSPETMYGRLLKFDKYNLPYQATEFEIRDTKLYKYTDEEVKQLTEETMTVYFSHPKVEGFWHWTFMDDKKGKSPWALFNYDGTPKPTGEKWIELMEGKFNTDATLTTDRSGRCSIRGYKGNYQIEVIYHNKRLSKSLNLDNDKESVIRLPYK